MFVAFLRQPPQGEELLLVLEAEDEDDALALATVEAMASGAILGDVRPALRVSEVRRAPDVLAGERYSEAWTIDRGES